MGRDTIANIITSIRNADIDKKEPSESHIRRLHKKLLKSFYEKTSRKHGKFLGFNSATSKE